MYVVSLGSSVVPLKSVVPLTSMYVVSLVSSVVPLKSVVPLLDRWCSWQACGAPDKPVVPLAGLWCPRPREGHDPCDSPWIRPWSTAGYWRNQTVAGNVVCRDHSPSGRRATRCACILAHLGRRDCLSTRRRQHSFRVVTRMNDTPLVDS